MAWVGDVLFFWLMRVVGGWIERFAFGFFGPFYGLRRMVDFLRGEIFES